MTTTTLRAAAARIRFILSLIDWQEVAGIVTDGLRILWAAARLVFTLLVLAASITWEHRAQIRAALVTAAAAVIVAAQLTLEAGQRARRWWGALLDASERLGRWYAALVAPAAATAPSPVVLEPEVSDLSRLSCRELRELLGVRKHLPKARLLELAGAA